ncbi:MAG TPA: HAD hydrolase-like protein [Phycisphaerae bacterium]|nr:HAD hydrolase-like protein [Phycisphaerae bacterium]
MNAAFEGAFRALIEEGRCEPIPGAEDAIRSLKSKGLAIAFTTGFSHDTADLIIESLGWVGLADVVLTPDDAGRGRPAPDLPLTALLRTGTSSVAAMVVVGDTESDAASGRAAGAGRHRVEGLGVGGADRDRQRAAKRRREVEEEHRLRPLGNRHLADDEDLTVHVSARIGPGNDGHPLLRSDRRLADRLRRLLRPQGQAHTRENQNGRHGPPDSHHLAPRRIPWSTDTRSVAGASTTRIARVAVWRAVSLLRLGLGYAFSVRRVIVRPLQGPKNPASALRRPAHGQSPAHHRADSSVAPLCRSDVPVLRSTRTAPEKPHSALSLARASS